jgi:hypothetical protein
MTPSNKHRRFARVEQSTREMNRFQHVILRAGEQLAIRFPVSYISSSSTTFLAMGSSDTGRARHFIAMNAVKG